MAKNDTVPYQLDAEMIGEEFRGSASDLGEFLLILADVTGRPETDFVVRQHVSQWAGAEEPSDQDWLEAVELFAEARPDLFGAEQSFDDEQLLRDVVMEEVIGRVYRLRVWDTYDRDRYGKSVLAYRFERIKPEAEAEVIFEGADFGPGAGTAIDSDEMLTGLMGFLTLRPGDTDGEYFAGYTPEQLDFAESYDAEAMQILGMEDEDGYDEEGEDEPHVRFLDYDEYLEGK